MRLKRDLQTFDKVKKEKATLCRTALVKQHLQPAPRMFAHVLQKSQDSANI